MCPTDGRQSVPPPAGTEPSAKLPVPLNGRGAAGRAPPPGAVLGAAPFRPCDMIRVCVYGGAGGGVTVRSSCWVVPCSRALSWSARRPACSRAARAAAAAAAAAAARRVC